MKERQKPNIRFLITSYFFVLLTAAFFIYGVYWFMNVPVEEKAEKYRLEILKKQTDVGEHAYSDLPFILERREGCLVCHADANGFTGFHRPEKTGCYTCHLGNRLTSEKLNSREDMIQFPGNSTDVQ